MGGGGGGGGEGGNPEVLILVGRCCDFSQKL